jgi:hypothetical protein
MDYWTRTQEECSAYDMGRIARQGDEGQRTVSRPQRHYRENSDELAAWICGYHDEDDLLTEAAA